MSNIDENAVHRIASDLIKEHKKEVNEEMTDLKKAAKDTANSLTAQDKILGKLETKVDAMYGNGSGKKGILDEIKDEQTNVRNTLSEETKKQASFRHEIRNMFETLQLKAETKEIVTLQLTSEQKTKKNEIKDWVKWVIGGIAFISWELFKKYGLKDK